jgi:hypothetical protein
MITQPSCGKDTWEGIRNCRFGGGEASRTRQSGCRPTGATLFRERWWAVAVPDPWSRMFASSPISTAVRTGFFSDLKKRENSTAGKGYSFALQLVLEDEKIGEGVGAIEEKGNGAAVTISIIVARDHPAISAFRCVHQAGTAPRGGRTKGGGTLIMNVGSAGFSDCARRQFPCLGLVSPWLVARYCKASCRVGGERHNAAARSACLRRLLASST